MKVINLTTNPHILIKRRQPEYHDYVGDDEEKQQINEMLKSLLSFRFNEEELKDKLCDLSYLAWKLSCEYQTKDVLVMTMSCKIDYFLAKELVSVGLNPIHLESDWRHFRATQE